MVLNDVDARSVSGVPDADAEVPAARHQQVRHLGIPEQSSDRAGVSVEHPHCSAILRVIPHAHGATADDIPYHN